MKRIAKPPAEPPILTDFRSQHPTGSWKEKSGSAHFKGVPGNEEVFESLAMAQGYLCAYCEIEIERGLKGQVEHFIPEHLSTVDRNVALDFANMLAACEGGVRRDIPNGRSEEPIKATQHCGQLKDNEDLSSIILDPRDICASPCLWAFGTDGSITANATSCQLAGLDFARAQATIHKLGLDRKGLRRFRAEVLRGLDEGLELLLAEDIDDFDAMTTVAREQLVPNEGRLPAFWSTIRHWAGDAAEQVLHAHAANIPGMT
jgi:uncharacterized protein (TIGR02646 family)